MYIYNIFVYFGCWKRFVSLLYVGLLFICLLINKWGKKKEEKIGRKRERDRKREIYVWYVIYIELFVLFWGRIKYSF